MNILVNKSLFWFLKDNISMDLSDPSVLEMYIQQILSRGRFEDVKFLLKTVDFNRFKEIFLKIRKFLPWEVRKFWEDYIENH